jgi:RNA polymerase-binding protein DksA
MEPTRLEQYRQLLLTRQQQLVQHIFTLEEDMEAMDADRDIERTDRVQEEALQTALTALDEQSRREVEEIQAALSRLEAGTYGTCEACRETISPERLEALPMARRCIDCQERLERLPRR